MDQLDILSGLVQHSGLTSMLTEPQLQAEAPPPQRERILILEDDPLQRRMLQEQLTQVGFHVVAAACLREARQHLTQSPPIRLGIFDVQLPDGSGLELCAELDGDARHGGLPIIVLSSLNHAGAVRQSRAAGGRYFLCKPYDPNVLLTIIERALHEAID